MGVLEHQNILTYQYLWDTIKAKDSPSPGGAAIELHKYAVFSWPPTFKYTATQTRV